MGGTHLLPLALQELSLTQEITTHVCEAMQNFTPKGVTRPAPGVGVGGRWHMLQAVSIIQLQQEGPKGSPGLMGKSRPRGTAMGKTGASQRTPASATILGAHCGEPDFLPPCSGFRLKAGG